MIWRIIPDGMKDDNQVPPIRMYRIADASPLSRSKGQTGPTIPSAPHIQSLR